MLELATAEMPSPWTARALIVWAPGSGVGIDLVKPVRSGVRLTPEDEKEPESTAICTDRAKLAEKIGTSRKDSPFSATKPCNTAGPLRRMWKVIELKSVLSRDAFAAIVKSIGYLDTVGVTVYVLVDVPIVAEPPPTFSPVSVKVAVDCPVPPISLSERWSR